MPRQDGGGEVDVLVLHCARGRKVNEEFVRGIKVERAELLSVLSEESAARSNNAV